MEDFPIMSIITQLPELYLRGSLANETMANLTAEEQDRANEVVALVVNHPEMEKHKRRYIRDMSTTIGGDYRDKEAAEQDYYVIIWRGVVMLYYHKKYEFECTQCGSRTYKNKTGSLSEIRSRDNPCKNCGCTGDDGGSPIRAIVVGERHPDPDSVIQDETQMSRWFSQQLSNATRQQLRENPITTTTRTNTVTDYADKQIVRSVESLLNSSKISHQKVNTDKGSEQAASVYFDVQTCPSRIIGQISAIRQEAQENGVVISLDPSGITIQRGPDCKSITQSVTEKVHVTMLTPSQRGPDMPSPIEVPNEAEQDHVAKIISDDFLATVDARLPTENCRAYRQIKSGEGYWYDRYLQEFGDAKVSLKNIESMLGLSKKELTTVRVQVEALTLAMVKGDY
jgi:hypothetical protein